MLRLISVLFLVTACTSAPPAQITDVEYARLLSPGARVVNVVDDRLPNMLAQNQRLERLILDQGQPLTAQQAAWAHALGVEATHKVRILIVDKIPLSDTENRLLADLAGPAFLDIGREIGGLTTGYGVIVAQSYADKDWLITHELVHVAQFEALGRERMLRRFLTERLILKDKLIPIEREAIAKSALLLGTKVPAYADGSSGNWITRPLR